MTLFQKSCSFSQGHSTVSGITPERKKIPGSIISHSNGQKQSFLMSSHHGSWLFSFRRWSRNTACPYLEISGKSQKTPFLKVHTLIFHFFGFLYFFRRFQGMNWRYRVRPLWYLEVTQVSDVYLKVPWLSKNGIKSILFMSQELITIIFRDMCSVRTLYRSELC